PRESCGTGRRAGRAKSAAGRWDPRKASSPRCGSSVPESNRIAPPATNQNCPMPKILLIEDQESYRTALAEALSETYTVKAVESGEQALEVAATDGFDLAVTDLRLGGMSGLEVMRRLKRADPWLEVIVMTAYGTVETAVEAMREGAYDYVTKP